MIANRLKPVLFCVALLGGLASVAHAENPRRHGHGDAHPHRVSADFRREVTIVRHRSHFVENNRWDRQGDGRRNRPAEIDRATAFPGGAVVRQGAIVRQGEIDGYYGGDLYAYAERGNGVYFLRDGDDWQGREEARIMPLPKAKIIDVEDSLRGNSSVAGNGCSFEHGVCVIRGH